MKTVIFVLLLSALDKLTTTPVRKHFYINIPMTWLKAQEYCRDNYTDLSTINSEVDYEIFQTDVDSGNADGWIGLSSDGRGWFWSDRSVVKYHWWTNDPANNTNNDCALLKVKDGMLDPHNCDKPKPFYCYKWVPGVTLVKTKMTWENALVYCRTFYSDLASLNTTRSLLDAKSKTRATVWTGLRFLAGSWFWVSGEPLELQDPLLSCPADPYRCGARTPKTDRWENRDCEEKLNFLCNDNTEWSKGGVHYSGTVDHETDDEDSVEEAWEGSGGYGGTGGGGRTGAGGGTGNETDLFTKAWTSNPNNTRN